MRRLVVIAALAFIGCAADSPEVRRDASLPPRRPWNEPREQLDKGDIVYGMQQIKPAVGACFDRYKKLGIFAVAVTVANSGHVTSAHVRGPDVETNDCVGHVATTATFPSFSGPSQSFVYPFILR